MKKIYLDERIFINDHSELKLGFLNINGLLDGNHEFYLNEDKNLINLDVLVLCETKLTKNVDNSMIRKKMDKWDIIGRYDAGDNSKHMGMMVLTPKVSSIKEKMTTITYQCSQRNENLQIQGIVLRMNNGLSFGFLYSRTTPNTPEVKAINKYFAECQFMMGDFNLSPKMPQDNKKLEQLCGCSKFLVLKETTRVLSENQLDHILAENKFSGKCFGTSYFNFISDHKTITLRITLNSELTPQVLEKINFDSEHHLRKKKKEEVKAKDSSQEKISLENIQKDKPQKKRQKDKRDDTTSNEFQDLNEAMCMEAEHENSTFNRKFNNPDMATCWLNSCLQLMLIAMDYKENIILNSELGIELLRLHALNENSALDPSTVKEIIVCTEDTRVASRLSRLLTANMDEDTLAEQSRIIKESRFDLHKGQQCVRDFFLCLEDNLENWPDVYSMFAFSLTHTSKCNNCGHENSTETTQFYLEMQVPPDESDLKSQMENYLNEGSEREYKCEEVCKKMVKKTRMMNLTNADESEYITVLLSRGVDRGGFQYHFSRNRVISDKDISLR